MKRKIINSLFGIFCFLTFGTIVAALYISNTTNELESVVNLHEVEQLRKSLIIDIQTVQTGLYGLNADSGRKPAFTMKDVHQLQQRVEQCSSCHHTSVVADGINYVNSRIGEYTALLNSSVQDGAGAESLRQIREQAIKIGDELIDLTTSMSHEATSTLAFKTRETLSHIKDIKIILFLTIAATFVLSLLVAARLIRQVIQPIQQMIATTKKIASGELGAVIHYRDHTEFGEIAEYFNAMSLKIQNSYQKLQEEVEDRWHAQQSLAKSENFLQTIFDSIHDPFCIIDSNHEIVKLNEAYAEMNGKSIDEMLGNRCFDIIDEENEEICKNCVVGKTFHSQDPCAAEKFIEQSDGSKNWLEIYTYPIINEEGEVSHVIEYIRDITDRKNTEEALKKSEERYSLAAQGANDGLWDWDLKTNKVFYSPRWKGILGLDVGGTLADDSEEWFNRIHPEDREQVKSEIKAHIKGHTSHFKNEHRILHTDGTYRWVLSRGLAVKGAHRFAGSITDITMRKRAEERLLFEAMHDSLTGLPNRALFMDRLKHEANREIRDKAYMFAVIFVDIDHFKVINDSLGHAVGDELLVAVSKRLEDSLRPGDTVARLGGDEFAVLLEDISDDEEAIHITKRVQRNLARSFEIEDQKLYISASIGIAFNTLGYDRPENLLRDADLAMYHAKANGRARQEVFDTRMYDNAVMRMQLETDLRRAIDNEEFLLHYQPVVSMQTGNVIGFEALIRWNHPDRGLVSPEEFIVAAEETGLIVPIGKWVIREAGRQLRLWQDQILTSQPLKMSVNVSSKQFLPNLVKTIRETLHETGILPGSLVLEITETMLMENAENIDPICRQLKEMHVNLHIDDFGTGYSSLSYLHKFPVDVLKIDRSFVQRIGFNDENMEIIKAIVMLAHSMNMEIIAEGVETDDQIAFLKSLKCEYVQGYLFSKPLDREGIEKFMKLTRLDLVQYSKQ
ncbi:MAG: EAL domain-containing protein [Nitrospiraceae bacterium]|nr:MAG: EAL domain-containing protein [Nitrospiraceae bacterium]